MKWEYTSVRALHRRGKAIWMVATFLLAVGFSSSPAGAELLSEPARAEPVYPLEPGIYLLRYRLPANNGMKAEEHALRVRLRRFEDKIGFTVLTEEAPPFLGGLEGNKIRGKSEDNLETIHLDGLLIAKNEARGAFTQETHYNLSFVGTWTLKTTSPRPGDRRRRHPAAIRTGRLVRHVSTPAAQGADNGQMAFEIKTMRMIAAAYEQYAIEHNIDIPTMRTHSIGPSGANNSEIIGPRNYIKMPPSSVYTSTGNFTVGRLSGAKDQPIYVLSPGSEMTGTYTLSGGYVAR